MTDLIRLEDAALQIKVQLTETGAKGETGDSWRPTVDAAGNISWAKAPGSSEPTAQNIKGPTGEKGDTGDTWKPTVSPSGDLSWAKNSGATVPATQNIKGPPGEIENLTSNHVTTALGYNPVSPTQLNDKVKTDVPENAVFTDTNTTYTEITTAEIDAGTASTLRTITGRRVKYILSGKLDKSNDTLETYTEKTQATTGVINLSLANVFTDTPSASRTYSITNAKSGVAHSFTLIITMDATVQTLTFPESVIWQGGEIPDLTTASKTYVLTFLTFNGGTTWLGMSGGEF